MDYINSHRGVGIQALIGGRAKVHAFFLDHGLYSRVKGQLLPDEHAAAAQAIERLTHRGQEELDTAARLLAQAGFDVLIVQ